MTALGVLLAATGAAAGTAVDFDAFFADFKAKRDGVATLEARFSQTSVLPDEEFASAGTVVFVKPKRVVFRYEPPDPTYLLDGERALEYAPDLKQVLVYPLKNNPQTEIFFLGFDSDPLRLREGYDVTVVRPEGEPEGAYAVTVRPKASDEEPLFEHVTLYLRGEDCLPYRIYVKNNAESEVTIALSGLVVNRPDFDPIKAYVALPEGTVIVVDDEVVDIVPEGGGYVPADSRVAEAASESPPAPEPRSAMEDLDP